MSVFIISFVIFLVFGVPISISIGFSAVLGCLYLGYPLVVIGQKMVSGIDSWLLIAIPLFSGIDSWLLIAIPLFILAGNLMNEGKITEKIFGTAEALVGWIPGGLGHANIVASLIFAGMSGSAVADAGGLGSIEMRAMKDHGYDDGFSGAVTAASSFIGHRTDFPAFHSADYLRRSFFCQRFKTVYGRRGAGFDYDGTVDGPCIHYVC